MNLRSICDRHALRSLSRWRSRLKDELRAALGVHDPDAPPPDMSASLSDEAREAIEAYEALTQEIAEQNCRRQCALMERYKGEVRVPLKLVEEMSSWWWQRY